MNNKTLKILMTIFALCMCMFTLIACGETETHTHDYVIVKHNENSHWLECECGDKTSIEFHKGGTSTENQKAKCEICNMEYGNLLEHVHDYAYLKFNSENHWKECVCGVKNNIESHKGGTPTELQKAKCAICNIEYGNLSEHVHDYNILKYDDEHHWFECSCKDKNNIEKHIYNGVYVSNNDGTKSEKCLCGKLGNLAVDESVLIVENNCIVGISDSARRLKKIVILDGISSIGSYAFAFSDVKEIIIPNSVVNIDDQAFPNCWIEKAIVPAHAIPMIPKSKLKEIIISDGENVSEKAFYKCDTLASVTILEEIKEIGSEAFKYCSSLTKVTFEENSKLTSIGSYAFEYCGLLTNIIIPNSVTRIGYDAFHQCSSLKNINIPSSITSICNGAFEACFSLESILVDKNNTSYKSLNGVLYSKDGETLIQYPNGKKDAIYKVPNTVKSIENSAFKRNEFLKELVFEENSKLETILSSTFYDCGNLTKVDIPSSVTSIGFDAFYNCTSLVSVKFEDDSQLLSIGNSAFGNCVLLVSIVIPEKVDSIGEVPFEGCSSLKNLIFLDTSTWYWTDSLDNWKSKIGGKEGNVTNPESNASGFQQYPYYWYKL